MDRRDFLRMASLASALPLAPSGRRFVQADRRVDDIAALVTTKMAEYRVPGVALGIVKDGRTIERGFGTTNVDDPRPVTPETVFTIASISKTVTATALMKLVEQGRVELDAPVQRYLPQFRVQDEAASHDVSLKHLLTHTPGWEGQIGAEDRGVDALAHFASTIMRDLPQLAAPGSVWSYNNAGFTLSGRVIEVVTGRTIHDALRELVFAPLGLQRTSTRLADAVTYSLSLGHREQDGRTRVLRPYQTSSGTTAGGVMTSLTDLLRYARFHLGESATVEGRPWLPATLLERMQTAQVKKNSTDDEMGIGWHLRRLNGIQTAAHGGTLNDHCLLLELVPTRNPAFVVLTNHADGWRLIQDVEQAILKQYEGIGFAPNQAIGHRGVNEAMTFHSKPLQTQPALAEYVATYRRPPVGLMRVREENGSLIVSTGNSQAGTTLVFYGPDVAYATSGAYPGSPFEFVRDANGKVAWIRNNGRIAKKDG